MKQCKFAGIETFDINNGTGFGVTLFVQGCSHHCEGCHNPETWDFCGGREFDKSMADKLARVLCDDNIVRLTISGGEPFDNREFVLAVCSMFKAMLPHKKLWIYTGYTFEQLADNPECAELLDLCDVLVDGEFQIDKLDLSLPFRGSANQRVIDMNETRKTGKVSTLF